MFLVGILFWY